MPKHSSPSFYGNGWEGVVKVEGVCGHCDAGISISIMTDDKYDLGPQIETDNFYLICPNCLSRRPDTLWPFMAVSMQFH